MLKKQVAELIKNGVPEEAERKIRKEYGASFAETLADLFINGKLTLAFDPMQICLLLQRK